MTSVARVSAIRPTPGNEQGFDVYRTDDVDIKASREGGYAVGWFAADEWLAYSINVQSEGVYTIQARVGFRHFPAARFGLRLMAVTSPDRWPCRSPPMGPVHTVRIANVHLHAGPQVLHIVMGPRVSWISSGYKAFCSRHERRCSRTVWRIPSARAGPHRG